jgi:hypothetical protein
VARPQRRSVRSSAGTRDIESAAGGTMTEELIRLRTIDSWGSAHAHLRKTGIIEPVWLPQMELGRWKTSSSIRYQDGELSSPLLWVWFLSRIDLLWRGRAT